MAGYYAAVFSDLESHSQAWRELPRDKVISLLAEYRYVAESLASQYGSVHRNFTGDGHLFMFEGVDAAVQFALRLIEGWDRVRANATLADSSQMGLRVGCHFGSCTQLEGDEAWVGRGVILARRVESIAAAGTVYVTESVLDLVDLPLYAFEAAGEHSLKGDHLPRRAIYRVTAFDRSALNALPAEELSAQGWFLKGVALIGTEREDSGEEMECYRRALALQPDFPEAHINLAIALAAQDDLEGAAGHYREALRLRSDYPEGHYNYALLLQSIGEAQAAGEHFRAALDARPDYVDAHHAYANLLKFDGELAEAENHYREALRLRPENAEALNNYAILMEDRGDPDRAANYYLDALKARPNYPEAHYNYAIHLERQGEPSKAERHYRDALEARWDYPEAHTNLAGLLHEAGDLAGAEPHYREALRLRPEDPTTHQNYALFLTAKSQDAGTEEEGER